MKLDEAIKYLHNEGYILEDTEEGENSAAVNILANLHYQICKFCFQLLIKCKHPLIFEVIYCQWV